MQRPNSSNTEEKEERKKMPGESTKSISDGFNTVIKNPTLFVPALAPIAIILLFSVLALVVFPVEILNYDIFRGFYVETVGNPWIETVGFFLALLVGFIAGLMIVDMANDKISGQPINLNKSLNVVMSRLGTLIVASIIAAVCAITFVLIPVALFIITIAIVEGKDAIESTKSAFNFVIKNLGEVIVFIIVVIVIQIVLTFVFGIIPVVGTYLSDILYWGADVFFTVAAVHFYLALRSSTATSTPPPPPPPPPSS